ncbi:MAG: SusC/RagA family TonB-linked outer membrane protein [Prevotella sp.]|nr:SusC/RagA family TonB-linked outer membrane protein [Bacteroides sp.]MCM1366574.1 SusC/RagA family TonB-linked outer membrane protein [Prevotella sp.]MCM1437243.1 SusC/RagA family TonB-linked outer membrane protein [Prevotella sp.]
MRKLFLILMTVLACSWSVSAQTRTVTGTVVDAANNEPLIGATVMPIGGGQGSATDIDGNFTLTVPSNVTSAKVSYVGYTTKTVTLAPKMLVELSTTSTNIDEVVVVAYGTANKESLTGSVAVVGSKEIEDRPVTSVTAALEGNAPGVQVNNAGGAPGSDPKIRIRGFNSINGSSAPLTVVDGIVYEGSMADLNPNDIESMSVLKDAASCALYGNRGANGVILITTKKAKNTGKVDVTLSIRQGMYTRQLPFYNNLSANPWMEKTLEGFANGGVSGGTFSDYQSALDYYRNGALINNYAYINIYGVPNNELFDANGKLIPKTYLPGYDDDLKWWKAISQTGYRQEYNVNAAAAGEKYNVFASVAYLKEDGYTVNSDFERFNGRMQAEFRPTSYFKFGVNLAAAKQESNSMNVDGENDVANPFQSQMFAPIYPVHEHDAATGAYILDAQGNKIYNAAGYLGNSNVAYLLRNDKATSSSAVIDGSIYGTAIIPYGFELTVRGNLHFDKTNAMSYMNPHMGSGVASNGSIMEQSQDFRTHTFMQNLYWEHMYGDMHHVDVLLNHENYKYTLNGYYVYNTNQTFPDVYNLINFPNNMQTGGGITEIAQESYLGRVRYNYDQKYFGEFSLRRDGTSKFSKDNRWGTFWSVGASWIITKENFMHGISWIDYLKLRAAYGSVGNNASASAYAYWSLYMYGPNINNMNTLIPAQLAAYDVKWEATKTFDLGLEGSLFNDRLSFSLGYYNKRNSDLLFNVSQPASAGSPGISGANATVLTNIGTMENIGWEISIDGTLIRNKDFVWTAGIDASFLKNKILKLPNDRDILGNPRAYAVGHSVFEYYLREWAGVDQMTGNSLYVISPDTRDFMIEDPKTGEYRFSQEDYNANIEDCRAEGKLVEYNGQLYTTDPNYATRQFKGSSIPTVYGSIRTALSWKGINLSLLFTYSLGGKTFDTNYARLMKFGATASALHEDILKSWTPAMAEGITETSANRIDPNGVPQINSVTDNDNVETYCTRWLTNSSYLSLKNINISYDLPKKWVSALQMTNLNIGCSIDNLFTVCKRKGMNPQASWNGDQGVGYVPNRVISFMVTARF